MNKEQVFYEINETQRFYVNELVDLISSEHMLKNINFNSPTGTGKTNMMAQLMSKLPPPPILFYSNNIV